MIPSDAITALETGLLAAAEVAALAFLIIVGIAAMKFMRRAVGGGAPSPETGANTAYLYTDDDFDAQWAELQAAKGADFVDHHAPIDQDSIDRAVDAYSFGDGSENDEDSTQKNARLESDWEEQSRTEDFSTDGYDEDDSFEDYNNSRMKSG